MLTRLISAECIKMKRKPILFLVFLGPIGILILQGINYCLRVDYLKKVGQYNWNDYNVYIHMFIPITLLLGITILASMLANIEHQQNVWKQLLALPVPRIAIYISKVLLLCLLLLLSSTLLFLGTYALGKLLQLQGSFDVITVLKQSYYPLLAGLPILVIQIWLSTIVHNQALPLSIGIVGGVVSNSASLPAWFIFKWPTLVDEQHKPIWFVAMGICLGLILLIVTVSQFSKKDVK